MDRSIVAAFESAIMACWKAGELESCRAGKLKNRTQVCEATFTHKRVCICKSVCMYVYACVSLNKRAGVLTVNAPHSVSCLAVCACVEERRWDIDGS